MVFSTLNMLSNSAIKQRIGSDRYESSSQPDLNFAREALKYSSRRPDRASSRGSEWITSYPDRTLGWDSTGAERQPQIFRLRSRVERRPFPPIRREKGEWIGHGSFLHQKVIRMGSSLDETRCRESGCFKITTALRLRVSGRVAVAVCKWSCLIDKRNGRPWWGVRCWFALLGLVS